MMHVASRSTRQGLGFSVSNLSTFTNSKAQKKCKVLTANAALNYASECGWNTCNKLWIKQGCAPTTVLMSTPGPK